MAEFILDRLRFTWKSTWSSDTSYLKDDIVYYEGKAYVCLQAHQSTTNFYDDLIPEGLVQFNITVEASQLGSGLVYVVNGVQNPDLDLLRGKTYRFTMDDLSVENYPLIISNIQDNVLIGGTRFDEGVVYEIDGEFVDFNTYYSNFSTASTRSISFTIPDNVPNRLFYVAVDAKGLGSKLTTRYSSNWELLHDGREWTGDWSVSTFYSQGQIAKFNGNLYRCEVPHESVQLATIGLTGDIENWSLYATGNKWLDAWNQNTVKYEIGDTVTLNGVVFQAIAPNVSSGTELPSDSENWITVTRSDFWRGAWTNSTNYYFDDIVKYGGIVYRCVIAHFSAPNDNDGLERDQTKWETVSENYEYLGSWQSATRYKINDVVKNEATIYYCTLGHLSGDTFIGDVSNWAVFLPGLTVDAEWQAETNYEKGDIVRYGGYTYAAKRETFNSIPTNTAGDDPDWLLIKEGYRFKGDWQAETIIDDQPAPQPYFVGDVVRYGGYLYVAVGDIDNDPTDPPDTNVNFEILVTGKEYKGFWNDNFEYKEGDIVNYKGTAYVCVTRHTSSISESKPDLDIDQTHEDYWRILIQGSENNELEVIGDILQYTDDYDSTFQRQRLPIGNAGTVLKSDAVVADWGSVNEVPNVFYVSTEGVDPELGDLTASSGRNIASAFRTIKYACSYINSNGFTPATVFVKTGLYKEELPISVPRDTAIVGDELRSTNIQPADGFEQSDMFLMRNGSGLRNCTLQGLRGELGDPNEYLTRRPTAGAFVALDPGAGVTDTDVWIINKSPYVQNVTTFGEGCVGMKVDGVLHGGGNRSIVANDFTQIISDGIGYWADNLGRSELVSVFTYYCHIGYLCTNGGVVRATNGNNSYGDYGSVAEGFDLEEEPITAKVDNRSNEAQVDEIITFGTTQQEILALGYFNAGQNYSTADVEFSGSGQKAKGYYKEYWDGAISRIRLTDPGDSSRPGGLNYNFVANAAQSGSDGFIKLSNADIGAQGDYTGMRIFIESGTGVGQYGVITEYDAETKDAIVSRESDGALGWDHINPGYPIEVELNDTTRYNIEPRASVSDNPLTSTGIDAPTTRDWTFAVKNSASAYIVSKGTVDDIYYLTTNDGENLSSETLVGTGTAAGVSTSDTRVFVAVEDVAGSPTDLIYINTGGGFSSTQLPFSSYWATTAAKSDGTVIVVEKGQGPGRRVAVSQNNGDDWTSVTLDTQNQLDPGSNWTVAEWLETAIDIAPQAVSADLLSHSQGNTTGLSTLWDEVNDRGFAYGDINEDGVIDADDADIILSYYNSLPLNATQTTHMEELVTTLLDRELREDLYNDSYYIKNGKFVLIDKSNGNTATSPDGINWKLHPNVITPFNWTDSTYGQNKVVLVAEPSDDSTDGKTQFARTFDGENWYISESDFGEFSRISYGDGVFIASGAGDLIGKSQDGYVWRTFGDDSVTYSTSSIQDWQESVYINNRWLLVSPSTNFDVITTGATAIVRAKVEASSITKLLIYNPGSNYASAPTVTLFDNLNTAEASLEVTLSDGVLPQPEISNRGEGYVNAFATITGDGFAEIFQTGDLLKVSGLDRLPGPGDNLNIDEINDVQYGITQIINPVEDIDGSFTATLRVTPFIGVSESPEHNTDMSIRQRYSQIRLTGHDFLDIGTGNFSTSRYPALYLEGAESINEPRPFNETNAANGGRVFYTSTDQDGNFRVGELFEVEQAAGVVTISASQFDLGGLSELSLGGIQIGGTQVVIREFSRDPRFTADSNNIVPTMRAIARFVDSRIAGGGSNVATNTLVAGQIRVTSNTFDTTSLNPIVVKSPVRIIKGIDGKYLTAQYFGMR